MSPVFLIFALVVATAWGYFVYRSIKKNGIGQMLERPWLPTNMQPQTFKPEIVDGKGHIELISNELKHSDYHSGTNQ